MKKIHHGDVVLTYARWPHTGFWFSGFVSDIVVRSSVVQKVLLEAWAEGTTFSVVVVDSRPMLEGMLIRTNSFHGVLKRHRETPPLRSRGRLDTVHLPSSTCSKRCHIRSLDCLTRRALYPFKRRCLLSCRHGARGNDGEAAFCPSCGLLRDV